MVKGLVQHLLRYAVYVKSFFTHEGTRQGTYTKSGSIVVLCMYLGQLAKVRDELRDSKINVVLDERDEDALRAREDEKDSDDLDKPTKITEVKVTDQVSCRISFPQPLLTEVGAYQDSG